MDQYPGNPKPDRERARTSREEPPKKHVERVVQGEVVRRKTPMLRRASQLIFGGDDAQSVWEYMIGDIFVPAARDAIADSAIGGLERLFGGPGHSRSRGRSRRGGGPTDYQTPFNRGRSSRYDEPRRELSSRSRSTHSFDEIILDSRIEAEEVLDRLDAMLDKYDSVTVADFYELCGIKGNYTDQKYGWTNIAGASPQRVRGGGYLMRMPPPEPLD